MVAGSNPAPGAKFSQRGCGTSSNARSSIKADRPAFTHASLSRSVRIFFLLLKHRRARLAQTCLLPPQTRGDGADVGDLAGTEAIDVGRAGLALRRQARLGEGRAGGEQRQQQGDRRARARPARKSCKLGLHGSVSLIRLAASAPLLVRANTSNNFSWM